MRNPGDVIHDRYRVEECVGRGSFAEVHRATDLILERDVALKLMFPSVKAAAKRDPEELRKELILRFQREALALAKLREPNTVGMYDFGATPDGIFFMAQEYIPGRTLKQMVREEGRIEPIRVAKILTQALTSLREAHAYGLLHRDIKPGNIMVFDYLGERDLVRVVDFGIAKAMQEGETLTQAGILMGTPRYVAPERLETKDLGPASDIYSLGMCGLYLLTGEEPFKGKKGMEVLRAQAEPTSLEVPDDIPMPDDLKQVVDKMLQKKLDHRYASASLALDDLERVRLLIALADRPELLDSAKADDFAATQVMDVEKIGFTKQPEHMLPVSERATQQFDPSKMRTEPPPNGFTQPAPSVTPPPQKPGLFAGYDRQTIVTVLTLIGVLLAILGAVMGVIIAMLLQG